MEYALSEKTFYALKKSIPNANILNKLSNDDGLKFLEFYSLKYVPKTNSIKVSVVDDLGHDGDDDDNCNDGGGWRGGGGGGCSSDGDTGGNGYDDGGDGACDMIVVAATTTVVVVVGEDFLVLGFSKMSDMSVIVYNLFNIMLLKLNPLILLGDLPFKVEDLRKDTVPFEALIKVVVVTAGGVDLPNFLLALNVNYVGNDPSNTSSKQAYSSTTDSPF
ncbi:hypothetical protein VNO77_37925 [Canavalia gladiata]|uniref:Uncharacterized protein n=1 Tax=Canavalia gladiata TaxID=3824 RepID=A0AAN9KBV4_CANGL